MVGFGSRIFLCFSIPSVGLALLLGFAVACGQSEGETCKEQNDCQSDLKCCPVDRSPTVRGTCEEVCDEDE